MDLFQFDNASSQPHNLNPESNYDFNALSPTTPEPDAMFGSHRDSPPLHINPGSVWNGSMQHQYAGNAMGKLLTTYTGHVEHAFGQVTPPEDSELNAFPISTAKRADSGLAVLDPTASSSSRSSVSSGRKSSVGRPSSRVSKESRAPDGEIRAGGKKDKYREKNRVAAAKCRAKKKEHVDVLEDNHRTQSALNTALKQTEKSLRDELSFWRTQALQHTFCNCSNIQGYNMQKAQSLTNGSGFGTNLSPLMGRSSSSRVSGANGFNVHSMSCPEASSPVLGSDSSTNSMAYPGSNMAFQKSGNGSQETSPMIRSGFPPFADLGSFE